MSNNNTAHKLCQEVVNERPGNCFLSDITEDEKDIN